MGKCLSSNGDLNPFQLRERSDEEEDLKYAYRRSLWTAFEAFVRPRWESGVEECGEREEDADFSGPFGDCEAIRSAKLDLWEEIIDELADRIFWDRDWQVSSLPSAIRRQL